MNKAVFSMGAILALVSFGGIFLLGQVIAPAPVIVMAARDDLAAGTALQDLAENSLVEVPLRGDATLLSSLVTQEEFDQLRASGAVLVEGVRAREPLRKTSLVSAENVAADRFPSRGLADPDLMIVRLQLGDNAPALWEGDLIDLGLAVTDLPVVSQVTGILSAPPVNTSSYLLPSMLEPDLTRPTPTALPSPTPTLTPTPAFLVPLAKTIVHAAVVTNVVREQPVGSGTTSMDRPEPAVVAVDVLIPRDAFEMVTMAAAAGKLQVGLLSPLANRTQGPSLGASLTDFIDWFYADREQLHPGSTAGMRGLATESPLPTATRTP